MSISLKTRKMLWGRAANRCAFPDCRRELVMDATETDDEAIIGDECHIAAREDNGPRGCPTLTPDERDKYDNLVLMCKVHHKIIDDQPNAYTDEVLKDMKAAHIDWVNEALNTDKLKQREDEIYSSYIETWIKLTDLDNWHAWSSNVLGSGQPSMSAEIDRNIRELRDYLFSRIWPNRYPALECAFENFRRVLQDFQNTFHEHYTETNSWLETEKFYKIDHWDKDLYAELGREYDFHVDLVMDLLLELTRAANYVCDKVREFILTAFRMQEGLILTESGPHMDLAFHTYRLEYKNEERIDIPYPGLEEFKKIRETRDMHFGIGVNASDAKFLQTVNW